MYFSFEDEEEQRVYFAMAGFNVMFLALTYVLGRRLDKLNVERAERNARREADRQR